MFIIILNLLKIFSTKFSNSLSPVLLNEDVYGNSYSGRTVIGSDTKFTNCYFLKITSNENGGAVSANNCHATFSSCFFGGCATTKKGIIYSGNGKISLSKVKADNCVAKYGSFVYTQNNDVASLDMIEVCSSSPHRDPGSSFSMFLDCKELEFTNANSSECCVFGDGAVMGMSASDESKIENCICYSCSGKSLFFIDSQVDTNTLNKVVFLTCKSLDALIVTKSTWLVTNSIFYNTEGDLGDPIFSTITFQKCFYDTEQTKNVKVIFDDCINSIANIASLLKGRTDNFFHSAIAFSATATEYTPFPSETPGPTVDKSFSFDTEGILVVCVICLVLVIFACAFAVLSSSATIKSVVLSAYHTELVKQYEEGVKDTDKLIDDNEEIDVDKRPKPLFAD